MKHGAFYLSALRFALILHTTTAYPQGIITTFAGTDFVYPNNPKPGISAPLGTVQFTAVDHSGNLYITDSDNNVVFKLDAAGVLTAVVGNGTRGFSGDGGPAVNASLNLPTGITVDGGGNLYIADLLNGRIRKVAPNGLISTVAGNGDVGYSGDGGPALAAALNYPYGTAFDQVGNMFIADRNNGAIRKVDAFGIITTYASSVALADAMLPNAVAIDSTGALVIADINLQRILRVDSNGLLTTVFSNGLTFPGFTGIAADSSGSIFVVDNRHSTVLKLVSSTTLVTVACPFGKPA